MNFEQKISHLELQLNQDEALLQKYEDEFKTEAARFLRQWWWDMTAQLVQRNPTQTRQHGSEGIVALKARVNELRSQSSALAEEFLSDERAWWHKRPRAERNLSERYYFRSERIGPKQLDNVLRVAMGAVAPILLEFGYIEQRRAAQWMEWDEAGENHLEDARHCYPYAIDWPSELLTPARSYSDRVQQATNRLRDVAILTREKEAREAESLWNES